VRSTPRPDEGFVLQAVRAATDADDVRRRPRLGGLLNYYYRAA